jgi:hypothetical protein
MFLLDLLYFRFASFLSDVAISDEFIGLFAFDEIFFFSFSSVIIKNG